MVRIRNAVPEDAEALAAIYAPYVTKTAVSFETVPPTAEEFRERMERILGRYPFLVLEEDEIPLGYAYAGAFKQREAYDWSCELTIYLEMSVRKRGYGRQLYEALERELSSMGMQNLYACIALPEREDPYLSRNSVEFHEHLGYRQVGLFRNCACKFDTWYHMVWMEKLLGDHPVPPPPLPFQ